jgi:hypothetical protein
MKIAKLTGDVVGEIADHKALYPNVSFPKSGPDATWLADNSCAEVITFLDFNSATQRSEAADPYIADGKVYTRSVTDMTADELAAVATAASNAVAARNRAERDKRLAACDWWATSDRTMTTEQTAYRQALRDITSHANWPNLESPDMDGSVGDWPTKPE